MPDRPGMREIVERAECIGVNGACNVPGYRTSVDVRFYDDDWRDLLAALGSPRHGASPPLAQPDLRWKCPNCGPLRVEEVGYESHSQVPFCVCCQIDVDPA